MGRRLGIIGGGNMGGAIARGAVARGVIGAQDLVIAEIDEKRRVELAAAGLPVTSDPAEAASAEQLMLALKPQAFAGLAGTIGPLTRPQVVISIMAGLGTRRIRAALGPAARVVRVMPNTPAQIGAGMAAVALGDGARPGDERLAVELFEALGRTVMVDEVSMHAVTAVSGSGPAYLFLLAESMEQAAVEQGLEASQAALLVRQTLMGAGRLLSESGSDPAALRRAVTSPAGTTEAAVARMTDRGLPAIIRDAVAAACRRGSELDAAQ